MEILTIGHGTQATEEFIKLLRAYHVELLVDTRSQPMSARNPQFSQRPLAVALDEVGIKYVFLGDKIGGRPREASLYTPSGKPDYEKIAATRTYQTGIEMLIEFARGDETVAIMCSESDFKECHRYKLVARSLTLRDIEVRHILKDGSLAENPAPQLALSLND